MGMATLINRKTRNAPSRLFYVCLSERDEWKKNFVERTRQTLTGLELSSALAGWRRMMDKNIPTPPSRLFDDKRLLNCPHATPAIDARRENKMRERFPVRGHEPVRGLNLIAPVQPSIPNPTGRVL